METLDHNYVNIEDEMRRSYLDYAMSVIIGRALPDVRDGFKPVHRRVLWAMHELGNQHNKAYKKSARIVGDVIGKYHPHGDSAVYDTIVRMAQEFSMRYPLVDGQGNFGSVDGDAAAAMRYTEARMSKITTEVLADIEKETVNFNPNYDESLSEPSVLPTRVPNLLLNGSDGIAVGMATKIPPHNLTEVVEAAIAVIKKPGMKTEELLKLVPGPDFPTGGFIYGREGIKQAYTTGRGIIQMRARAGIDRIGRGTNEYEAIIKLIAELEDILSNEASLRRVIVKELEEVRKDFGDARRTQIIDEGVELSIEDMIADEDVAITVTKNGYVKRTAVSTYQRQGRGGKRRFGAGTGKNEDRGVRGIDLRKGDYVVSVAAVSADDKERMLSVSECGFGKQTPITTYRLQSRGGKGVINMKTTDKTGKVVAVFPVDEESELMIITKQGKLIRIEAGEIRKTGRGAQGVRLIKTDGGDKVTSASLLDPANQGDEVEVSA